MGYDSLGTNAGSDASADGFTYSEAGMTMTNTFGHFDRFKFNSALSPDPTDFNPVIHEGNGGSGVSFSMGGTAFDLLSLDVVGWFFGAASIVPSTTVTFSSSAGGNFELTATDGGANFTGLLDFASKAGFSNITGFAISMPNPGKTCALVGAPANCPNFAFDNVTFRAPPVSPVPVPAAGWLLFGALGMIVELRRRA